jgi:hypothetical protein
MLLVRYQSNRVTLGCKIKCVIAVRTKLYYDRTLHAVAQLVEAMRYKP